MTFRTKLHTNRSPPPSSPSSTVHSCLSVLSSHPLLLHGPKVQPTTPPSIPPLLRVCLALGSRLLFRFGLWRASHCVFVFFAYAFAPTWVVIGWNLRRPLWNSGTNHIRIPVAGERPKPPVCFGTFFFFSILFLSLSLSLLLRLLCCRAVSLLALLGPAPDPALRGPLLPADPTLPGAV